MPYAYGGQSGGWVSLPHPFSRTSVLRIVNIVFHAIWELINQNTKNLGGIRSKASWPYVCTSCSFALQAVEKWGRPCCWHVCQHQSHQLRCALEERGPPRSLSHGRWTFGSSHGSIWAPQPLRRSREENTPRSHRGLRQNEPASGALIIGRRFGCMACTTIS